MQVVQVAGKKRRLMELLKERYPDIPDDELYARVLSGEVLVDGAKRSEPSSPVDIHSVLEFRPRPRFVSRGGEKLDHILGLWGLPVEGKVFLDAGSSSGGFTDCLLQHGARRVYAVDVGYNQLDYRLRIDPRVEVMERRNVMDLDPETFVPPAEAAVADLSFRSLERAAIHLLRLVLESWAVVLVKPQFEWRRPDAGFRGVVRERRAYREILSDLARRLWTEGAFIAEAARSPIQGRKGNTEFFFLLKSRQERSLEEILDRLEELLPE